MDAMPIYVYETSDLAKPVRRFELRQSFHDSRSELIPKRVKPCTASSLAVTEFSSAADGLGRQSAPAARIRTDLRCRTLISTPCSTLFAAWDNYQWIADKR